MANEAVILLLENGYYAIFLLIFLQEIGVPNPIPNEFVLLFSGYLVFTGVLKFGWVLLAAFTGDLLAAFLVYELFYLFGGKLLSAKPAWLPLPWNKIEALGSKMRNKSLTGVILGRMTPFIKGYVSVWNRLIRREQKQYGAVLVATAAIWSSMYVLAGFFLGSGVVQIYNQFKVWCS